MSTHRDFVRGDEIALFAEVYESGGGPPHKVAIALTMNAEGGQTVFQTREERDSSELAGNSGGYGFTARVPLKDIAPGLYVLRIEAQARVADRGTVAREIIVNVLPGAPAGSAEDSTAPRPNPGAAAAGREGGSIQMQTLNADMMSGIDRAEQVVARTDAEWQALWRRHAPGRPAPAVDFSKHMVIGVFLGSRSSGGYQVQITNVRSEGDTMIVQWSESRPGPGQVAAQVMTAPSHLVTVPRHSGAVKFEKVGQ
jgi:hypothetical protein